MCAERKPRAVSGGAPSNAACVDVRVDRRSPRNAPSAGVGDSPMFIAEGGVFNGLAVRASGMPAPAWHRILFAARLFLMRPAPRRIVRPSIQDRMLFVPRDAVLAGSHGQITDGGLFGRVELASFAAHRGGLTQDLLRLLFLPEQRATAFAFLSTRVGQRFLKSTAVGTSIPSMRLDLLALLPYPELFGARASNRYPSSRSS